MAKYAVFYDDTGRLKRVDPLRYDSTSNAFQFYNSTRSHYFAIKANDSATTDTTFTWPPAPVNGAFLRTDSSGNLSWAYNFITKTNYDFTATNGATIFDTGSVLSGKYVTVFVNGILKRPGASFDQDYVPAWPNATQIQFSYGLPAGAWVRIIVDDGAIPNQQEKIAVGNEETWTPNPSLGDMRNRYVEVFRNGQLLRQGADYDYIIDPTDGRFLVMTSTMTAGAWMKLVVY